MPRPLTMPRIYDTRPSASWCARGKTTARPCVPFEPAAQTKAGTRIARPFERERGDPCGSPLAKQNGASVHSYNGHADEGVAMRQRVLEDHLIHPLAGRRDDIVGIAIALDVRGDRVVKWVAARAVLL